MRKQDHKKRSREAKEIVKEKIILFFKKADESAKTEIGLSNRYITLARNLSMKFKVKIPPELQKKYCKHCYKYLLPGLNCRVRTKSCKVVYACSHCHKYMRFPFVKERREKRAAAAKEKTK